MSRGCLKWWLRRSYVEGRRIKAAKFPVVKSLETFDYLAIHSGMANLLAGWIKRLSVIAQVH